MTNTIMFFMFFVVCRVYEVSKVLSGYINMKYVVLGFK